MMGHFSKALEKRGLERSDKPEVSTTTTEAPVPEAPEGLATPDEETPEAPPLGIAGHPLVVLSDPWSYSSEQFRSIKTTIMFPEDGKARRVILVTSAMPAEGKSFVAANVAAAIAGSLDNQVMVIDSDLRQPVVADIFSLPDEAPGLDAFLTNRCGLDEVIHPTHLEKLSVIPAGKTVENPSELISSASMHHLIDDLKMRYADHYVIIDSPPPLFAPETVALSRHVDGIVVVVRNDKTSKKVVGEMLEKVDRTKVIGIVLNRHDVPFGRDRGYSEYYAYRKGRGNGSKS